MSSNKKLKISADNPLSNPENDKLGYASFASYLANSISELGLAEGFVVAIYGPWGAGKTTVLNFVIHTLTQKPEEEQPIVVSFNPWLFSGRDDLTKQFFWQLLTTLGKNERISEGIRKGLAEFAEAIAEVPLPYISLLKPLAKYIRPKPKDINLLKRNVEDALRDQGKPILAIIDDIDRLTSDEIRQLFGVIKVVANFPNIIYLIALDKKVAIEALREEQGISGEVYLEKIVQVPFELPLPDRGALRQLLFNNLDAMLVHTPDELFDHTYWGNIYLQGIDSFIRTPRDVVRLSNTLSVTYPPLKKEVNAVDFIAIESIRVFASDVYDIVRNNIDSFAGHISGLGLGRDQIDKYKSFHEGWLGEAQHAEKDSIIEILKQLFPKVEAALGGSQYGSDFEAEWRRNRRICSPDLFQIFFRLAVPTWDIPRSEAQSIMDLSGDSSAFGKKLIALAKDQRPDGKTRLKPFLRILLDNMKSRPTGSVKPTVGAFLDVGDDLLEPPSMNIGLVEFSTELEISVIVEDLLRKVDPDSRFNILKKGIKEGRAISLPGYIIYSIEEDLKKPEKTARHQDDGELIQNNELNELKHLVIQKIRAAALDGSLIFIPRLSRVLHEFKDWGDSREVRDWVEGAIKDDEKLIILLSAFRGFTSSRGLGDAVGRSGIRLDPEWLEPFLDPNKIIDRVRILATNKELSDEDRATLDQFIIEHSIRQEGKDPDTELRRRKLT